MIFLARNAQTLIYGTSYCMISTFKLDFFSFIKQKFKMISQDSSGSVVKDVGVEVSGLNCGNIFVYLVTQQ